MEDRNKVKIYKIIMLIILVVFITFLLTSMGMYQYFSENGINSRITVVGNKKTTDLADTLNQYHELLEEQFLGEIDEEKLKEGAIKGYIEALDDKYTEYISKEDMEDYMDETLGNFVGIGVYITKDSDTNKVMVLAPIKGSPAEEAGILPGDLIVSIDGVEYSADDMTTASNKIKGEEGSKVTLKILRGTETKTFEVERKTIILNPVEAKVIDQNIGYIEFTSFDEGTSQEFKAKYEELKNQGIKSLIIDLRNNGGGIVDEALEIADYILDKEQVILYEVNKKGEEKVSKSENDPIINIPVIVLTNENTASSSEILAIALKENAKAKLVGTKTYGKGIIQTLMQLKDGSGIKFTTAEYLSPNKSKINEVGVEPDEKVELPETVKNIFSIKESEDTQLQKAIEMAK